MSITIEGSPADLLPADTSATIEPAGWPRLLEGTELIGRDAGSGLREPPYLVRRRDGQVVQLSKLLYVVASHMDGRDLAAIAHSAGAALNLRITSDQVAHVAERKLAPLGLVARSNGDTPKLESVNGLLALKHRIGIVPERAVNAIAGLLRPLFLPPVAIVTLAILLAFDAWLGSSHGIGSGLRAVISRPALGLALFALVILSLAFHECGHATACRYGGARPGRIGIGFYLVWPVFYCDVTDSYRLTKAGRLRTDLGGVYFNVLFALAAAGAYVATSYEPLLLVVVSQQILILDQFMPWIRLDGYHIVSDVIGVPNLFARITPVMRSLLPGRAPERSVTELKPWARAAVTSWVLTTVVALTAIIVFVIVNSPGYVTRVWQSLILQFDGLGRGVRIGSVVDVLFGATSTIMILLPAAAMTMAYLRLCGHMGSALALRRVRVAAD